MTGSAAFLPSERVSRWERWASVVCCALLMAALVGYCVGFAVYLVLIVTAHHFVWPPSWYYGVLAGTSGFAMLLGGIMGWDDPLWGGVTFHAREHGYVRSSNG